MSRVPVNFKPATKPSTESNLKLDYKDLLDRRDYWGKILGRDAYASQCASFDEAIRVRKEKKLSKKK